MHDQLDFLVPNLTEGRRRALSSREPWNRGNRTAHGFHGFHGFHVNFRGKIGLPLATWETQTVENRG